MGKIKVVTVGGGSGHFVILSAMRDLDEYYVTAVVSMYDSGGSTGVLRDELGVLPPGDILKCIIALSPYRDVAREIFQLRFNGSSRLTGHNAGNLLLSYFSKHTGSFPDGVEAFSQMLHIVGRVFPVTTDRATLVAELEDGSRVFGEKDIDRCRGDRPKIKEVFLVPHHTSEVKVYEPVISAIAEADYIILGPGDLYTSIVPTLMAPGVADELRKTKAQLVYFSNIMTKYGETDGYQLDDFINKIENSLGRGLDLVVANNKRPTDEVLERYATESAHFVEPRLRNSLQSTTILFEDLLEDSGDVLRHSEEKLAQILSQKVLV